MQLRLLGSVELVTSDGRAEALGSPKQRALLAVLALRAGEVVSVQRLIDELWPDTPPRSSEATLQSHLSGLRSKLTDVPVRATREGGYVLDIEPAQVDLHRFEELMTAGEAALAQGRPDDAGDSLRRALDLCRGEPLADVPDGPIVQAARVRLQERYLEAVEARISADLACGRHAELVGELDELVTTHPFRERLWSYLMLARYRSGCQADALAAYESARQALADQLGIDPSPELQQLHEQMLRQEPALDAPPGFAPSRDDPGPPLPSGSPGSRGGATPSGTVTVRGYELLDELGSGSLGVVYRGHQPAVERDVAIKIVRPELANDPEFVRRFEIEAQRVARLEHPHIVPLYDYWREPDAAYLVMRWLRGGSVAHALQRGAWPLEAVARLVEQVAAALDYVHRQGVAHLDVKPANVLLDGEGYAYLSDFGIASRAHQHPGSARTLPYVSPEHVAAQPLTPATDVFALGLVAFELLTGRHPYEGESLDSLSQRLTHQPLPRVSELRADLAEGVSETLERATAADPSQRFEAAGEMADALRRHTGDGTVVAPGGVTRNPYKGLRAFDEIDADDFFGRERLVEQLLARLDGTGQRARLITVVGPSGSGKSSLVRAGLLPALRQGRARGSQHWFVATMRPGTEPMAELERALVEVAACDPGDVAKALASGDDGVVAAVERALPEPGAELVLVVDQFEELFTLSATEQRAAFTRQLQRMATAGHGRLRVVLTVRADFYDHPLLDPELGDVAAATTVAVPALSTDELERAVVEPARAVGVRLDADLVAQIVNDVATAPAALPLLQYALTELFARRTSNVITLDSYRAIGGVRGALAGRADQLYASLHPQGQQACHQLFLRLVTVDRTRAGIRRRVAREELAGLTGDDTIDHVLETFGSHRLLTFDRDPSTRAPTVEVAHEALLEAWGRLRDWIERARTDLLMQQRLAAAAAEWVAADRDEAYLLHGARLAEFERWAPGSEVTLTHAEQQLLAASRSAEASRQQHEQARQERERDLERRSHHRLRAVAAISLVAALAAAGLSVFAFDQRDRAQANQQLAVARGLATAAISQLSEDPLDSILLGIRAVQTAQDAEIPVPRAQTALREAIRASLVRRRLPAGGGMSVLDDGRIATLGAGGQLTVWGADGSPLVERGGQATGPVTAGPGRGSSLAGPEDVAFSPDGSALVVADADQRGVIRDASDAGVIRRLQNRLTRPQFGPRGELIAGILPQDAERGFEGGRIAGVWDAATGELRHRLELASRTGDVRDHAFGPDGARLATINGAGRVDLRLWDLRTGEMVRGVRTGHDLRSVAFHPDGERVIVGTATGDVLIHDVATGIQRAPLRAHRDPVISVAVSSDGEQLVTAADDTRVWHLATRQQRFVLRSDAPVTEAAFAEGGNRVVTTSTTGTTRVWDVSVAGGFEHAALATQGTSQRTKAVFGPDGRRVASVGTSPAVQIRDVETLQLQRTLEPPGPMAAIATLAHSRDGDIIAALVSDEDRESRVDVWNAATGRYQLSDRYGIPARDVALSPDGATLAIAARVGDQHELRVVDAGSGAERFTRELPERRLSEVAYAPDGQRILAGTSDGALVVTASGGDTVHELDGVDGPVRDVAFTDDGRLAVARGDGAVGLFDLADGRRLQDLPRAPSTPTGLDAEAGTLAVAHGDTVTVRDLDSGDKRFELEYDGSVAAVRLDPRGRYLATTLAQGPVQLHVVQPGDLLELARRRAAGASLSDAECQQFGEAACP